jgi:GT2 family glycosyltransferase
LKGNKILPPIYDAHGTPLTAQVDLIVPFHGQYDHVSNLIQTLWDGTRGIYYNLCLVDDGSPNSDFLEQIADKKVPSVICIQHEERLGFGAAVNSGIRATTSPWVVILNSDVWFNDSYWLKGLGQTYLALKDQGVKMVSARFPNSPSGTSYITEGDGDVVLEPKDIGQIIENDMFLPLVCALAHRELFSRIGYLKEYPLGWYEDLEFACRMQMMGFKQAISGGSHVQHVGGVTVKAVCDAPLGPYNPKKKNRSIFESNFDRCCADIKALKK